MLSRPTQPQENLATPSISGQSASGTGTQFPINWALASRFIISFLALIYLILIPLKGVDEKHRFGSSEAGILTLILLLNSDVFERLQEISIGKNGLGLKLIDSKLQANFEANQKESRALTLLGTLIEDRKKQKEFFDKLLNDGERETIEDLFLSEKNNKPLLYEKNETLCQRLRHLRTLDLIEPFSTQFQVSSLPDKGNLRDYFKLSCTGKICLALGSSKIKPEDIVNESEGDCDCYDALIKHIPQSHS